MRFCPSCGNILLVEPDVRGQKLMLGVLRSLCGSQRAVSRG
jgi:DNA-directed RNA polymerase subunit M/transcription elongation factor TFIIS